MIIHTYIHIHVYMYTCICTYIHIYMYTYIHIIINDNTYRFMATFHDNGKVIHEWHGYSYSKVLRWLNTFHENVETPINS
jgi:hypothetical protein